MHLERAEIPASQEAPAQSVRLVIAPQLAPRVVDLHNWNGTERGLSGLPEPLVEAVRRKGWNCIRPRLLGPNGTLDSCCGSGVIATLDAAIEFAAPRGAVDRGAVFLVGESALCALMSGRISARPVYLGGDLGSRSLAFRTDRSAVCRRYPCVHQKRLRV